VTLAERLDLDDDRLLWIVRAMQALLAAITLYALATLNWGLVINAGVSFFITFLPGYLDDDLQLPMNAGLALWITTAVFLHAVGALGPYEWFGWYDSVTHALSASIVAGAGYTTARALDVHYDDLTIPPGYLFGFVLVFVLAFGVLWEILEFASGGVAAVLGGKAVLAQRGVSDIVFDLFYNTLGGVLVAALGAARLGPLAGALAGKLGDETEQ
jgi:hypothetical protein